MTDQKFSRRDWFRLRKPHQNQLLGSQPTASSSLASQPASPTPLKAIDHPLVQPVLERVAKRRIDYLTASFRQAGMPRMQALNRARLTYAAYVGFLQMNMQLGLPKLKHDEFNHYVEHLVETLIPSSG